MKKRRNGDMETWTRRYRDFKWKMEAQAIFLSPFIVCSSCKRKFVVWPFVDEETNRIYPVCKRTKRAWRTCLSTVNYNNEIHTGAWMVTPGK